MRCPNLQTNIGLYVTFIGTNHEIFDHPVGSMLGLFHMTLGEFGVSTVSTSRTMQ